VHLTEKLCSFYHLDIHRHASSSSCVTDMHASCVTDMHPPPHVSLTCILLTEKLCSFYHLDIHRHSRERAGKKDRGGSAVSARYIVTCILLLIVRGRYDTTQTLSNKDIKRAYEAWDSPCTVSGRLQSGAFRGVAALGRGSRLGSL